MRSLIESLPIQEVAARMHLRDRKLPPGEVESKISELFSLAESIPGFPKDFWQRSEADDRRQTEDGGLYLHHETDGKIRRLSVEWEHLMLIERATIGNSLIEHSESRLWTPQEQFSEPPRRNTLRAFERTEKLLKRLVTAKHTPKAA